MTSSPSGSNMQLLHADWSVAADKRWVAAAKRIEGRWRIFDVRKVGTTADFVRSLISAGQVEPVVAGFDFPIGVPASYGARTGLPDFPTLLKCLGDGVWSQFGQVARSPGEISLHRPFYPAGAQAGLKQSALLDAHGVASLDELRRTCERATQDRRAACPLFWTLGGNQVGRGALSGWSEVVGPALAAGAALWPYHGDLASLLGKDCGVVLAETYPAEAYSHVGVSFAAKESKRRQSDRLAKSRAILGWAERHGVALAPIVMTMLLAGFGEDAAGEDRFDAFMGLLGMIEVVEGRRADGPSLSLEIARWEGWILGQLDAPPARGSPSSTVATEGAVDFRLLEAVLATNSATRAALSEILLRDRD